MKSSPSPASIPMLAPERAFSEQGTLWLQACEQVFRQGRYILGDGVQAFEHAMANMLGIAHAIGVSSGSDALLLALQAIGVGPGDEVLLPAFTFFATAGSVARLGATPVFVDLIPGTFAMCPMDGASKRTHRTKAVIVVHLFGLASPMAAWHQLCQHHQLALIEDCAQALLAPYLDHPGFVGTHCHVGCYSFFPSKTLGGFGDGGLVVTACPTLAQRLKQLRVHGASQPYMHQAIGGNFRLDALQAALLHCKLPFVQQEITLRRQHARAYHAYVQDKLPIALQHQLKLPPLCDKHTYNQFVIRVLGGKDLRNQLQSQAKQAGISTAIYYPLGLHQQPCFAYLPKSHLPHTEQACREVLAWPIFPQLTGQEQEQICRFWSQSLKLMPSSPHLKPMLQEAMA